MTTANFCGILLRGLGLILLAFSLWDRVQWPLMLFASLLLLGKVSIPRLSAERVSWHRVNGIILFLLVPQVWFLWQFPRDHYFLIATIVCTLCLISYAAFCVGELSACFRLLDEPSAVKSASISFMIFLCVALALFASHVFFLFSDYSQLGLHYYFHTRPLGVHMVFTIAMLNALLGLQYIALAYRLLNKIKIGELES